MTLGYRPILPNFGLLKPHFANYHLAKFHEYIKVPFLNFVPYINIISFIGTIFKFIFLHRYTYIFFFILVKYKHSLLILYECNCFTLTKIYLWRSDLKTKSTLWVRWGNKSADLIILYIIRYSICMKQFKPTTEWLMHCCGGNKLVWINAHFHNLKIKREFCFSITVCAI